MQNFFRNLRTLILALILASAVWVSAVTQSDPDEIRTYPQPVPLELIGQDPGMVIVGTLPEQVSINLRAPRSVWEELNNSNKPIRAILDLSGITAGEHQLKVQTQIAIRPVQVISVTPQTLNINLQPLASKSLPIQVSLRGEPAIGYLAGEATLEKKEAVLSGPQEQVEKVAHIMVDLSIAGMRQDISTVLSLRPQDAEGKIVSGLTISPENITVSLPITQQGGYRDIAVKVAVRGQQAGGYRVTNISVFPPVITVFSSNPLLVNDLPGYVETEPLNLNGESEDVDTRLKLNLPADISVVGEQTVQVQVGIAAIEGSLSLNGIPVNITGLAEGLKANISPALVDVILTGPLPMLDKLTPNDIQFLVDLSGMTGGTHQAVPQSQILISDIRVQSIIPGIIEVTISPQTNPSSGQPNP